MTIKPRHKATIDACIDEIVHMLKGRAMHYNIKCNEKMLLNKSFIWSVYQYHENVDDKHIKKLDNGLYYDGDVSSSGKKYYTGEIHVFTRDLLECYKINIAEEKVSKYLLEIIDTTLVYFKIKSITIGNTKYYYDINSKTYKEFNG